MTILSEDPTILAGGLAIVGAAFLVALKTTQQGKYLAFAGIAFGLSMAVLVAERLWVTDSERIEQVVYDLKSAVERSDVDGVLEHLAPDVQYGRDRGMLPPETTRVMIRANLARTVFEFVKVGQLRANVYPRSRRGTAEFRVIAKGQLDSPDGAVRIGTANSEWSLGFQEVEPHVWKVNRITPVSVPEGVLTRERMVMPERFYDRSPNRPRRHSMMR